MRAVVADINNLGGVYVEEYDRKLPIKLIILDDESEETKSGSLAEDLILSDKVNFLAGFFGSPGLHAMVAKVAEAYQVPYVAEHPMESWMSLREEITPKWKYTWTPGFAIATPPPEGDVNYGKPGYTTLDIGYALLDEFGDQTNKIAGVFASDEPAGTAWYRLFPGALEKWGAEVIGADKDLGLFPPGTTDFTPMIREWMDNDVEILWGNCPSALFATLWRQAHTLGFQPKMVYAARASLFYSEVLSWGGDLPLGVGTERWWDPSYQGCFGIGDTTPQTLYERWHEDTGRAVNPNIGFGYTSVQILVDAIERAGTIDGVKVNQALADTDLMTIASHVKFDENQFSRLPLFYSQWQKTDDGEWSSEIIVSQHDFIPETAEPLFPIPYE